MIIRLLILLCLAGAAVSCTDPMDEVILNTDPSGNPGGGGGSGGNGGGGG